MFVCHLFHSLPVCIRPTEDRFSSPLFLLPMFFFTLGVGILFSIDWSRNPSSEVVARDTQDVSVAVG